jgi:hypothetical protein
MPYTCRLICDRFLGNIKRTYVGRNWSGRKTKYDPKVFDWRVVKHFHAGPHLSEEYIYCRSCEIYLLKSIFSTCPCCGNTNLTISFIRGGRGTSYGKVRYWFLVDFVGIKKYKRWDIVSNNPYRISIDVSYVGKLGMSLLKGENISIILWNNVGGF